jgi:hypothetical protein
VLYLALLWYCAQDAGINPSIGEPVAFRLAVNHAALKAAAGASGLAAAHAGRRATQVESPKSAQWGDLKGFRISCSAVVCCCPCQPPRYVQVPCNSKHYA